MTITVQLFVALGASIFLAMKTSRLFGAIGAIASGVALLMAQGIVSIDARGLPLGLILSAGIATAGIGGWLKVSDKTSVTVATALAAIGVLRALAYF